MNDHSRIQNPVLSTRCRRTSSAIASCLAALSMVATVTACGGGGGDSAPVVNGPGMPPPPSAALPELPLQRAQDAANSPILYVDRNLHIGSDVAPPADNLQQSARHGDITVSHGRVADGIGADELVAYLADDARDSTLVDVPDPLILAFSHLPTVVIGAGTSQRMADLTARALQIINAALPPEWQLRIDPEPGPADPSAYEHPPHGQILIQFAPFAEWPYKPDLPGGAAGVANLVRTYTFDEPSNTYTAVSVAGAVIFVDHTLDTQHTNILNTIVHEILHTLGRDHPTAAFENTIMSYNAPNHTHSTYPLDREALLAIYSRLQNGSTVASLAEDLGPWSDTSTHLLGEFTADHEDISFGVALRNGLAQPWATGPAPLTNLEDNAAISGTASWSGRLLGFTPQAEPVAGAADLTIALHTLDGDLDFTELEHWDAGQAPGAAGSGTTWSDGDLSYDVDVRGNTFTRAGGDEGIVTGAFLGTQHKAMGGTLQRDDLSAAFGGKR